MPNSQPETLTGIVAPPGIEALRPEWRALWRRCPGATPFQAPEWLLPWARHHAPGRCGAVALRREGRLVGLAPVFCWDGALLLAGTGPSDHADIPLEPGAEEIAPLLLETFPEAVPGPFERIEFQQLPPGAPVLDAAVPEGWRDESRPGGPCFAAPLTGEDGRGAVSKRQRANWRYGLRRLEREGGTVELARGDEICPAMEDFVRLHGLRWRERGEMRAHDRAALGEVEPRLRHGKSAALATSISASPRSCAAHPASMIGRSAECSPIHSSAGRSASRQGRKSTEICRLAPMTFSLGQMQACSSCGSSSPTRS